VLLRKQQAPSSRALQSLHQCAAPHHTHSGWVVVGCMVTTDRVSIESSTTMLCCWPSGCGQACGQAAALVMSPLTTTDFNLLLMVLTCHVVPESELQAPALLVLLGAGACGPVANGRERL
jgi:hypothetical protein